MDKSPNILLFLPDGMTTNSIESKSCLTPNINLIKNNGSYFKRAYTTSPICSPARSSLMTGMLPHNHGVLQVEHCVDNDQSVLRDKYIHWADRLVKNNFITAYFGKWHIERTNKLDKYGWNHFSNIKKSFINPGMGYKGDNDLICENMLTYYQLNNQGYSPFLHYALTNVQPIKRNFGKITNSALKFLDNTNKNCSWAICVSFSEPNEPLICNKSSFDKINDKISLPKNFYDSFLESPNLYRRAKNIYRHMTKKNWIDVIKTYYGLVYEIDIMLGLIINKLKSIGEYDNTIIIITSDHGRYLGAHGMDFHNIGVFEEIMNIPLIISGPDIKKYTFNDALVSLQDLCPTILELANLNIIDKYDGKSFAKLIKGNSKEKHFNTSFAENHGSRYPLMQRVLWHKNFKFVFNGFDEDELYDLKKDPFEMSNLANLKDYYDIKINIMNLMWNEIHKSNDKTLLQTHYMPLRLAVNGPNSFTSKHININ